MTTSCISSICKRWSQKDGILINNSFKLLGTTCAFFQDRWSKYGGTRGAHARRIVASDPEIRQHLIFFLPKASSPWFVISRGSCGQVIKQIIQSVSTMRSFYAASVLSPKMTKRSKECLKGMEQGDQFQWLISA